ncbi:MAG: hypothetical protein K5923_04805 [Clostridia bacterium]|nr:hypothetical protein [Clostridia bacterium]
MNAEKHVTPILLIVVVFVALFSTYAWFSATTYIRADLSVYSGTPTSFSINEGQGGQGDDSFEFTEKYSGQKGYKADGTVYTDADAPFYIFKTISYVMSGENDVTVDVALEKLIVTVGSMYLYNFNNTLKNVVGLTDAQISALTEQTRLNYYVTSTAYALDSSALPSGPNPNSIYFVYNETTSKVTHIIYTKSVVENYVTYDYWPSNGTSNDGAGILPTDAHTSAKGAGIPLVYGTSVTRSGSVNYVGVYAGFYGYDSVNQKYTECVFSNAQFRGSSFEFIFSAGGQ